MKFRFLCFALLLTSGVLLRAAYPTAEQAGFQHAALIYRLDSRRAADFKPMIARHDAVTGKLRPEKVFDCFIFLNQQLDGIRTESGKTDQAAWRKQIELFFHPGREVAALQQAAAELKAEFGGRLPQPLKVMFYIPYLHPGVTAFGDVDGDGKSENAAHTPDIDKIIKWYTGEIAERLKACPDLELIGFYWMRENVDHDAGLLAAVSKTLRNDQHKFLWIPWFRAGNWENWRKFGFDCAIMQSNYAFTSPLSGGTSRSNRLDVCAELCRRNGLGVEIEFPYQRNGAGADIIRQTYDAGSRHGFQNAPSVWFFSTKFDEWKSPQPEVRAIYDWTCDYINGKDMSLPAACQWQTTRNGAVTAMETTWEKPRKIGLIDIFLDENPASIWRGAVEVEGKSSPDGKWMPLAWTLRGAAAEYNDRFQNITLALHAEVTALRLIFRGEAGAPEPPVTRIGLDGDWSAAAAVSRVYRKNYDSTLTEAQYAYPDLPDGRKLLDGKKTGGWQTSLGWNNAPLGLVFELGEKAPFFDEVRIHTRLEPVSAIQLPNILAVAATDRAGLERPDGLRTPAPEQFTLLRGGELVTTGQSPDRTVREGYFLYRLEPAAACRYLVIGGEAQGWGFISEVEFLRDGKAVDHTPIAYRITAPLQRKAGNQGDNRAMLTDGRIEPGTPERYVLLPAGESARISFTFDRPEPICEVKVYFGSRNSAFAAPQEISVELDGMAIEAKIIRQEGALSIRLPQIATAMKLAVAIRAGEKPVQLTEVTVE